MFFLNNLYIYIIKNEKMKKLFLVLIVTLSVTILKAQETPITSDQNPDYKISLAKYQYGQQVILEAMNTTLQNTYKAYDWTEAKQERKNQRIDFRQKRAIARINSYRYLDCNSIFNRGYYNRYW